MRLGNYSDSHTAHFARVRYNGKRESKYLSRILEKQEGPTPEMCKNEFSIGKRQLNGETWIAP